MRRSIFPAAVMVLTLIATGGCTSRIEERNEGPGLITTEGEVGGAVQATGRAQYYSMQIGPICTSGPGVVRIVKVTPIDPVGGFKVSDFSVFTQRENSIGATAQRLRSVKDYSGTDEVRTECLPDGTAVEALAVETYKPSLESAHAAGFTIHYFRGDSERTVTTKWHFRMCQEPLDAPTCTA